MTPCLLLSLCVACPSGKADPDSGSADARQVVAAIVAAAKANQKRTMPLREDALLEMYVRAAATAARGLPKERQGRAFALGVGVAVDPSALMRRNPVVAGTWARVESDEERRARLKVIGEATLHGRHDLAQHFVVSMGLTAVLGERKAEAAGLLKEVMDAAPGGSGFSFADLAADYAGVAFAKRMMERAERLEEVENGFRIADHALPARGLPEGLSLAEIEKRFGGTGSATFRKEREELKRRVLALPGYQEKR